MGKRSSFKRRPQDAYDTPPEAITPLLGHLPATFTYWEPCAGKGALIETMAGGNCTFACDVNPRNPAFDIDQRDALLLGIGALMAYPADFIITNPPWTRSILHPMIEHFSDMRPTWLLFDADWMHTKQSAPYLWRLRKIVSVGRVSWMQNSTSGKDNCAWYLFDAKGQGQARFFGRTAHGVGNG